MQEELADVVFQRTDFATKTLRQSADHIPRRLRTLLFAVDGRSAVALYVPFLSNLAPLSPKLRELESLGMLERCGPNEPEYVDTLPAPLAQDFSATVCKAIAPREPPFTELTTESVALQDTGFEEQLARLECLLDRALAHERNAPGEYSDKLRPAALVLQEMLSDMERYLFQRKGLDALPLTLMFQHIHTVQQLREELPDYAALLEPHDEETWQHLERIRRALAPFRTIFNR